MYVESLQFETKSLMSEASDSGMGTEGAPSEFDMDIGGQYRKVKITNLSVIIIIMIIIIKLYLNTISF